MCYNPVRLKSGLLVGCGHCLSCLKLYQDQWTARLNEEAKCWRSPGVLPPIIFFTLKYRDDSIPCKYLFATERGFYQDDVVPVLPFKDLIIYDEWTSLTRESRFEWSSRHESNLARWRDFRFRLSGVLESNYCPVSKSEPLFGFEFHSVRKSDVQGWLKRGRRKLEFNYPDVFAQAVNPRFRSKFRSSDGSMISLPSCALPKSVKYFITSEYGPRTLR